MNKLLGYKQKLQPAGGWTSSDLLSEWAALNEFLLLRTILSLKVWLISLLQEGFWNHPELILDKLKNMSVGWAVSWKQWVVLWGSQLLISFKIKQLITGAIFQCRMRLFACRVRALLCFVLPWTCWATAGHIFLMYFQPLWGSRRRIRLCGFTRSDRYGTCSTSTKRFTNKHTADIPLGLRWHLKLWPPVSRKYDAARSHSSVCKTFPIMHQRHECVGSLCFWFIPWCCKLPLTNRNLTASVEGGFLYMLLFCEDQWKVTDHIKLVLKVRPMGQWRHSDTFCPQMGHEMHKTYIICGLNFAFSNLHLKHCLASCMATIGRLRIYSVIKTVFLWTTLQFNLEVRQEVITEMRSMLMRKCGCTLTLKHNNVQIKYKQASST